MAQLLIDKARKYGAIAMEEIQGGKWRVEISHESGFVLVTPELHPGRISPAKGRVI
jgi:hypothetical protein